MPVSISITSYPEPPATQSDYLRNIARAADELGVDTVWVADHLLQADPMATPDQPMLEAYTTLGFLAAVTDRVRLGVMVSPATLRSAAVIVKAVTTLDVLSGGRAWLGLGAGYHADEGRQMGVPLPPVAHRYEALEDTLQLARRMFTGNQAPFTGRRISADRPLNYPAPTTRPHPPILVGGMGERQTLRLVATHADACNLFDIPDRGATMRHKLDVLREHCHTAQRPFEMITKTVSTALMPNEDLDTFRRRCDTIRDYGIDHIVVITRGRPWDRQALLTVAGAVR